MAALPRSLLRDDWALAIIDIDVDVGTYIDAPKWPNMDGNQNAGAGADIHNLVRYDGFAKRPSVNPPARHERMHKGFLLRRGKDGLITVIDENGDLLSDTMKFLDFETVRVFLDQWLSPKDESPRSNRQIRTAYRTPRRKRRK